MSRKLSGDDFPLLLLPQLLVCCIGAVYLYELSLVLSGKRAVAALAVGLYATHPYLVRQSVAITEVPLFATLLIVSCYYYRTLFSQGRAMLCGLFFGLSVLTRSIVLPGWVLALGALAPRREAWIILSVSALVVLPFTIRNYRLDGSLLPTRSGINLFEGNRLYADRIIPRYGLDLLNSYAGEVLEKEGAPSDVKTEKTVSDFFTRKALQYMAEHPFRTLRLKLLNILYLFSPRLVPFTRWDGKSQAVIAENGAVVVPNPLPRPPAAEWAYSLFVSPLLFTAAAGLYMRRKELAGDLILHAVLLSFVTVYALYFPASWLRAPMEFVLIFYSAFAICTLTPYGALAPNHSRL